MKPKAFAVQKNHLPTHHEIFEEEKAVVDKLVAGFVPREVIDIHTHIFRDEDFNGSNRPQYSREGLVLGTESLKTGLQAWLPGREIRALCFGIPARGVDTAAVNGWVQDELSKEPAWWDLALASPFDKPEAVEAALAVPQCRGIKVYHLFTGREDSFDCQVEDFAPEWMWDILNKHHGILMLHIVKDDAMADAGNQKSIARLCRKYPNAKLILAHVARSFSHRHALDGIPFLRDIDNAWVDTSAVCESQSMVAAIEHLGPERILFGSDYPISNFRGRSLTLAKTFHWIYENAELPASEALSQHLTLVGMESLTALREAAELFGLTGPDLENIFRNNALRVLGEPVAKPALEWAEVKTHVACGTGLMSKRKEQFDEQSWPTFFSRCHGAEVWDLEGRRFVDFAGGVGAILLGYGDKTIERALRRRLSAGTYCTLVNPEEDELAQLLLRLHPWADKVRFARGGGEAMTMAVRIARAATRRSGVAFCGYHGWQDWYLAANLGDDSALDGHLLPGLQPLGVPRELKGTASPFFYNDMASLEKALADLQGKPAAIVMEPMRSSLPKDGFLHKVKELAAASGAVFVLDEVTSGWRFGFPGAHKRLGFEPDIAVYAKAMSNGSPSAAIVGRENIMDAADPSFISSSYWTDGLGTSAALACIRKLEAEDAAARIWAEGEAFGIELRKVAAAHPLCKMSVGSMPPCPSLAFGLGKDSAAARTYFVRKMVGRGFLSSTQIYLMLAHTPEQKSGYLSAMHEALSEVEEALDSGALHSAVTNVKANLFARLA